MEVYKARMNAFLIDLSYVFVVQIIISIFVNFFLFTNGYYFELNPINYFLFFNSFLVLMIFKDIPKGGSIGKQKYGLSLVTNVGGEVSLFYRIIRNIPLLIFFLDFAVLKICNNRLGDILLKIEVVEKDIRRETKWQSILVFILHLIFVSVILEVAKSNFPFFSFYFDSKHKLEIERIQSNINYDLSEFVYKSDVQIRDKNMKVRLFTSHRYNNDTLFFIDKKKIRASFSKYIDTSSYKISIELIEDLGSRKYFSTFKINKDINK